MFGAAGHPNCVFEITYNNLIKTRQAIQISPGVFVFQGDFLDTIKQLDNTFKSYALENGAIEQQYPSTVPTKSLIENNYISKIKQLVIEIHSPADIQLYPDYFKGLSDIKNKQMFDLLQKINNTHTLVHFHANNGCKMTSIDNINIPHVFELTYIRNEFITEKIRNSETLPTTLDSPNIPSKKDYILQGYPYTI